MHLRLRPRPPRSLDLRARLPVADESFYGVKDVHRDSFKAAALSAENHELIYHGVAIYML